MTVEKICLSCGAHNPEPARFCANCGVSLTPKPKICASCGMINDAAARYCIECGANLSGAPAPSAQEHPALQTPEPDPTPAAPAEPRTAPPLLPQGAEGTSRPGKPGSRRELSDNKLAAIAIWILCLIGVFIALVKGGVPHDQLAACIAAGPADLPGRADLGKCGLGSVGARMRPGRTFLDTQIKARGTRAPSASDLHPYLIGRRLIDLRRSGYPLPNT